MEKFSAYRDPGTGIQPFLTPVPPLESELLSKTTLPFRLLVGTIRTAFILLLCLLYAIIVHGACLVLLPIRSLHNYVVHLFTYLLGRTALFALGLFWISPECYNLKRGRGARLPETWNVMAGDIIVSNWFSWIEIVWLAIRYNPVFVIPVMERVPETSNVSRSSTPVTHTPGRRTGTGSANIQMASRTSTIQIPISGFKKVSLLQMIYHTGRVPLISSNSLPLDEIRRQATRPVVVFPECTTSNGRGLLRFAEVFHKSVPVKGYQVFIMTVRYDPPTAVSPSLTHTLSSNYLNPLHHLFWLCTSLSPAEMSIRLLAPSESPGNQLFMASEVLADYVGSDQLIEACAILMAQMGRLKRMGLGWEDKHSFLEFYKGKLTK